MPADRDGTRSFSNEFDNSLAVGTQEGNRAFFGRDVLQGLIDGIDDLMQLRQPRWQQLRSLGPALLGSAMWIDDPQLITKLEELAGACIVVTKQIRAPYKLRRLEPLRVLNDRTPGLPIRAFPALGGMAPRINGKPVVAGPYDPIDDSYLPTIRTLGYRRREDLPPIMHAKLALIGHLWWHDEGPLGHVEDVIGFTPQRLWVSSANFTSASRRSLEFGYWTEDGSILQGAERFLVTAMRFSEGLDPDADSIEPDLARVQFDDAAMAEAYAEMRWDETDEDST